jgi:hypothetical protein
MQLQQESLQESDSEIVETIPSKDTPKDFTPRVSFKTVIKSRVERKKKRKRQLESVLNSSSKKRKQQHTNQND